MKNFNEKNREIVVNNNNDVWDLNDSWNDKKAIDRFTLSCEIDELLNKDEVKFGKLIAKNLIMFEYEDGNEEKKEDFSRLVSDNTPTDSNNFRIDFRSLIIKANYNKINDVISLSYNLSSKLSWIILPITRHFLPDYNIDFTLFTALSLMSSTLCELSNAGFNPFLELSIVNENLTDLNKINENVKIRNVGDENILKDDKLMTTVKFFANKNKIPFGVFATSVLIGMGIKYTNISKIFMHGEDKTFVEEFLELVLKTIKK